MRTMTAAPPLREWRRRAARSQSESHLARPLQPLAHALETLLRVRSRRWVARGEVERPRGEEERQERRRVPEPVAVIPSVGRERLSVPSMLRHARPARSYSIRPARAFSRSVQRGPGGVQRTLPKWTSPWTGLPPTSGTGRAHRRRHPPCRRTLAPAGRPWSAGASRVEIGGPRRLAEGRPRFLAAGN